MEAAPASSAESIPKIFKPRKVIPQSWILRTVESMSLLFFWEGRCLCVMLLFIDDIDTLMITITGDFSSNDQISISIAWREQREVKIVSREMNRENNVNNWNTELRIPPRDLLSKHILQKIKKSKPLESIESGETKSDKDTHDEVSEVIVNPNLSLQAKDLYAMLVFGSVINKITITTTKEYVANG